LTPVAAAPRQPSDLLHSAREEALAATRQISGRIEKIIAPSTISDFSVGYSGNTPGVVIALRIKRDTPFSEEQRQMLARMLTSELGMPVELTVATEPFVPPLVFRKGEAELTETMKGDLKALLTAHMSNPALRLRLESFPETGLSRAKQRNLTKQRAEVVSGYLREASKIPAEQIEIVLSGKSGRGPKVVISVLGT